MAGNLCSKCGGIKKGSYLKESHCGKCVSERRKVRRKERRAKLGLPEWGTGRDPKCKNCRTVKEESYKNSSLCRSCKLIVEKERYRQKLAQEGKELTVRSRSVFCSCGKVRENQNDSYCYECRSRKGRERRAILYSNPEWVIENNRKEALKYRNNFLARLKKNCREATHRLINSGKLKKQPCEVCGVDEMVEAHHDDYTDPTQVRWFCKIHHMAHHREFKILENTNEY